MPEQTLDKKMKFAIIGTSSSGKTTLAYKVLADLKILGVLVDGVLQQDRRLCFDRSKLETNKEAQYAVIFNMVVKESEMLLKDGVDVIISDRSVLDFYAYYETMYGRDEGLWNAVLWWCKTYDKLFYVKPLTYQDDGTRPSECFRDKVDKTLRKLIQDAAAANINVISVDREVVYKSILHSLKRVLSKKELNLVPLVAKTDCLVGGSYAFNRATKFSDVDVYVKEVDNVDTQKIASDLKGVFGVEFEVREVPAAVWDYLKDEGFMYLPFKDYATLDAVHSVIDVLNPN